MDERGDFKLLGRIIGTFTGWDGDEENFIIYDFKPVPNLILPECNLSIEYTNGVLREYDNEGNVLWTKDIIDTIKHLPKAS